MTFYAHENDFRKLVYTPDTFLVELDINGQKINAIMQDIQFHPVTEKILHIDFLQVFNDKPITVSIPVILKGVALGVRNGGVLMFRRNKIITKGLVSNMPDSIEIDIEHLGIGMFIYIKDLNIEGCQFLAPDNSVVVGVKTARTVIEVVEEAEEEVEAATNEDNKEAEGSAEQDKSAAEE